jgi:hypothetical protein
MKETVYVIRAPVCMKHHHYGDNKPFPRKIRLECGCTFIRRKMKLGGEKR